MITWQVVTFKECPEAHEEIQQVLIFFLLIFKWKLIGSKEIEMAKKDLKKRGLKF